jgi:hypothetical protein
MTPRPVALWVSTFFATFAVELTESGLVDSTTAPIARWAVGKRFSVVHLWARRKDRQARFAWLYEDGTVGDVWR